MGASINAPRSTPGRSPLEHVESLSMRAEASLRRRRSLLRRGMVLTGVGGIAPALGKIFNGVTKIVDKMFER
jgi:hypothetical protein